MATFLFTLNITNPATGRTVAVRFQGDPDALTQQRWAAGFQKVREALDVMIAEDSGQQPIEL